MLQVAYHFDSIRFIDTTMSQLHALSTRGNFNRAAVGQQTTGDSQCKKMRHGGLLGFISE